MLLFPLTGLDLILNSSREYTASCQSAEYDADFERSTYINGIQHMVRGLPRDLDPAAHANSLAEIRPAAAAR